MKKLSNEELINELSDRFEEFKENLKSLKEQRELTQQLQKVNKKLEESESLKSHFLSNIRNEINNPMASILGLSRNIMNADSQSLEQVKSMAKLIFSEAFQLDFQLRNIFAAAELEAGESHPTFSNVHLEEAAKSVKTYFTHWLNEKNIEMRISISKPELVRLDASKLNLILINLVANAIEFSTPHAKIDLGITVDSEKEQILFVVKDEGIGIAPENQEVIFDRFRQLDNGMTKVYGGHGLGLCIVKALIDLLEGTLNLQSEQQVGSTFSFRLPLISKEATAEDYSLGGDTFFFDDEETFF